MKNCAFFSRRIVALVCTFLQIFLIFGTTAFAVSNESVDASESEQLEVSSSEIDGITEYSLNNTIVTQGVRSYCTGRRHLFLGPGATNSVEDPIEALTE